MKSVRLFFTLLLLAGVQGGAFAQKQEVLSYNHLAPFNAIEAASGWEVTFTQGDQQQVEVIVSKELADKITVTVKEGKLKLGLRRSVGDFFRNSKNSVLKASVTAPSLNDIELSSGASMGFATSLSVMEDLDLSISSGAQLSGLKVIANDLECSVSSGASCLIEQAEVREFSAEVSSGGSLKATVKAEEVEAEASSGSDITLSGSAVIVGYEASSGAEVEAHTLKAKRAKAEAGSGGAVSLYATEEAVGEASISGSIRVYGNPKQHRFDNNGRGVTFK